MRVVVNGAGSLIFWKIFIFWISKFIPFPHQNRVLSLPLYKSFLPSMLGGSFGIKKKVGGKSESLACGIGRSSSWLARWRP